MPTSGVPGQQATPNAIRAMPATRATVTATPVSSIPSSNCPTNDGTSSNAIPVARVAGIALIALGVACWTSTPLVGMLTYSAAVTLYLAWVGFAGGMSGILLWPAVVLHVILTALLARAATSVKKTKT